MKITEISVSNFLSWAEGVIPVDSGITALVGEGNKGKSTVLKSLAWATIGAYSTPQESLFGKKIEVTVKFDTNRSITRTKGGVVNKITFGDKTYEKFGGELPKDALSYTGYIEQCFAFQHSPPFLIGLQSPTVVYQQLSSPLGGDIFLQSAAVLRKVKEDSVKEAATLAKLLEQSQQQVDALAEVVFLRPIYETLLARQEEMARKNSLLLGIIKAQRLQEVIVAARQVYESLRLKVDKLSEVLGRYTAVRQLLTEVAEAEQAVKRTATSVENAQKSIGISKQALASIEVCPLCERPFKESDTCAAV